MQQRQEQLSNHDLWVIVLTSVAMNLLYGAIIMVLRHTYLLDSHFLLIGSAKVASMSRKPFLTCSEIPESVHNTPSSTICVSQSVCSPNHE